MKTTLAALAVAGSFALWTAPASGQDLTGTWNVQSQTQRGTQNITLELVQDGSDLAGSVVMSFGGRRGGGGHLPAVALGQQTQLVQHARRTRHDRLARQR